MWKKYLLVYHKYLKSLYNQMCHKHKFRPYIENLVFSQLSLIKLPVSVIFLKISQISGVYSSSWICVSLSVFTLYSKEERNRLWPISNNNPIAITLEKRRFDECSVPNLVSSHGVELAALLSLHALFLLPLIFLAPQDQFTLSLLFTLLCKIKQNCLNFWTNDAILILFEI